MQKPYRVRRKMQAYLLKNFGNEKGWMRYKHMIKRISDAHWLPSSTSNLVVSKKAIDFDPRNLKPLKSKRKIISEDEWADEHGGWWRGEDDAERIYRGVRGSAGVAAWSETLVWEMGYTK